MNTTTLIRRSIFGGCLLAALPLIRAQDLAKPMPQRTGTLGYLDPVTGAFHAAARPVYDSADMAAAATGTPTTGKFVFNVTITVASSISTSQPISCQPTVSVTETNSSYQLVADDYETAAATATRNGSTATCSVSIPYSWTLATPSSDPVSLTLVVSAQGTSSYVRYSGQNLPSIKVPANGSTTTETVKVTI